MTPADTTTPFWRGTAITTAQANYSGDSTVPVDSFEPNPWGLYNVHGNVMEWTEDWGNLNNNGNLANGSARRSGEAASRIVRGGSQVLGVPQNRHISVTHIFQVPTCAEALCHANFSRLCLVRIALGVDVDLYNHAFLAQLRSDKVSAVAGVASEVMDLEDWHKNDMTTDDAINKRRDYREVG